MRKFFYNRKKNLHILLSGDTVIKLEDVGLNGGSAVCGFHGDKISIAVFLLYQAVFYVVSFISEELAASIFIVVKHLNINSVTRD